MNLINLDLLKKLKFQLVINRLRRNARQLSLVTIGVALLAFGTFGLWQRFKITHNSSPMPDMQTTTYSDTNPDETSIKPSDNYQVPSDQPRRIILPSIQAEGFVQKVGTDQQNRVAVPSNIHLAGWYVNGAKPGDNGLSIIDGHVQGKYQPGVFKDLKKLVSGDTFTIEFGDYSSREFEVVSINSYSVAEMEKLLFVKHGSINQQLNLITCGGRYDASSQQYDERVLVISKLKRS